MEENARTLPTNQVSSKNFQENLQAAGRKRQEVRAGKKQRILTSFPDAKIGGAVGLFQIVDKILDKGHLVVVVDDLQTRHSHLGEQEHVNSHRIHLQMAPFVVANYCLQSDRVELGVNRIVLALGSESFEQFESYCDLDAKPRVLLWIK